VTATPVSAPEATSGNPLNQKAGRRKAGVMFGIDLRDLFEDSESNTSGLEGFVPMTKTTSELKGRTPTTLTYKQPSEPARTVTEYQAPGQVGLITPPEQEAPQEAPKAVETPPAPKSLAEMSAQDIFSNYSRYDQGEQGLFGGQDVDYLRGQGVGDEVIREVARLSSATQQTPAAVYERLGGTLTSPTPMASTGVSPQAYATDFYGSSRDVGQQGLFGGQDVDAMRNQGYTDEQIRATASAMRRQGQELPPAVFRRLGQF
jgi:hypothetical protein